MPNINSRWHVKSNYTYREVSGSWSYSYRGDTADSLYIDISCSLSQTTTYEDKYGGGYNEDTVHLQVDGVDVDGGTFPLRLYTTHPHGSGSASGSKQVGVGDHTVKIMIQCRRFFRYL